MEDADQTVPEGAERGVVGVPGRSAVVVEGPSPW